MEKTTLKIADIVNRPKLDWIAMKIAAFKRLDENNRLRDSDPAFKEIYPRIGDHIFRTVEKLISLYRKKFDRGELDGFKLRFTYGYFKRHAESKYVIKTLINHFNTLTAAFNSIFKVRQRATLKLPNRDCNCVMVEFAPGIVCYTNPAYNQIHDIPSAPLVLKTDAKMPVHVPFSPLALTSPEERTEGPMRLGAGLGQLRGSLGAFFKRRQ